MIDSVVIVGLFLVAAAALHLVSIAVAAIRLRRAHHPLSPLREAPPVTVLRPACGIENHLEMTLRSAFELDYPDFEVVFCVASAGDPVIRLIEELMADYPGIPSRLMIGDDPISINPKLNNLVKGWRAARHEWILMADSNVLLPADYLARLVARWAEDGTGLVCSPPTGFLPESFAAELECAFLNTHQARWQIAADAVGFGFAQGKTMLWRRQDLDAAGGIAALARIPAEDAAATKLTRASGRSVRLIDQTAAQPLGRRSVAEVWHRQLRWARLRRATFPAIFLPELLAGGFLPLAAAAYLTIAGVLPLAGFLLLFAAWYGAEIALARLAGWPLSTRTAAALVLRDLLFPAVWIMAWTGNRFVWRGTAMDMAAAEAGPSRWWSLYDVLAGYARTAMNLKTSAKDAS